MQVRAYADLPGVISVPSRYLPLTAFRELLFGPALSLSHLSWVSPLVLTGSFSSSHTSPGCSSEAPSQYAATVSRQKLQHGSSFLISSPGRAVLGLPASLLMFLCQVPTAHRQTMFNRVVDVLLTGVREGQVHASDAIVRFFLSRLVVRKARSPG